MSETKAEPIIVDERVPPDFEALQAISGRLARVLAAEFLTANVNTIIGALIGLTFAELSFSCESEAEIKKKTAKLVALLARNEKWFAQAGIMMWTAVQPTDRQNFDS